MRTLGSPPLVRERPTHSTRRNKGARITPARAGKTTGHQSRNRPSGDHPRSCGKDKYTPNSGYREVGSPPLVRERLGGSGNHHLLPGITPARAGKTQFLSTTTWSSRDHPRSCGKDSLPVTCVPRRVGSPPLVRERLGLDDPAKVKSRITPARAGKTWC